MAELNLKQEKFCQAYVMLRNATESAKSAGYSTVSAHTQGHRLVQREDIKERIEELEKENRKLSAQKEDGQTQLKKYKDQLFLVKSNKEYVFSHSKIRSIKI